jgi:3-ketosteroid 9alpha-monooxygenase subunit A
MTILDAIPKAYRDHTVGFPRGWYCVADSDQVSADAMLPVSYLNRQLVVYRDTTGAPHVADAYCPHLGAHLASADGCIDNGEILCPFHKWRFDTADGSCASIPYSDSVPPRAKLETFATIEFAGLVMMWWDPTGGEPGPPPFDPLEANADKLWLSHSAMRFETTVPLRDLFENAFDTAHIQQLHRSVFLPEIARLDKMPYGLEVELSPSQEGERSKIDQTKFNFSGVGMSTMLSLGEGFGFLAYTTVTPIDDERTDMHVRMFIMDTGSEELNEQMGSAFADRIRIEIEQDMKVLNYKKHIERPVLCRGDGPVMKWRRYVAELYGE